MLKERLVYKEDGFQLNADAKEEGRVAYYMTFNLKDAQIQKAQTNRVEYWTPQNAAVQKVPNKTFVCVWEIKDGEEVEEYCFYHTNGNVKAKLGWRIERARKYGENAYMITLEWMRLYDYIHKRHIYLKNKKTGEKFAFLKETIGPLDVNSRVLKDQYIILLPEGVNVENLSIEADELLQQKYLLVKN